MKRILSLLLAFVMVLSLAACSPELHVVEDDEDERSEEQKTTDKKEASNGSNKKPAGKKAYIRLQLFGKASTAWVSNVELYEAKK